MANHAPFQPARKTARGKRPSSSLMIINAALSESPLLKRRRTDGGETGVQEDDFGTVFKTTPNPREVERPSTWPPPPLPSISSVRASPDPTPTSGARLGEVSDSCYRNIVELFTKRYMTTFNRDRLALEGAYTSGAIFSCRFISSSRSPSPYYLTKCNTGTIQGPSSIIQTLSSFSRRIAFFPPAGLPLDVTIDILRLPDMNYFVTIIFNTVIESVGVSVDMVFLLKENARLTGRQDRLRVLWSPFVVMSHQIILRS